MSFFQSITADDGKQFQCLNMVLNNKNGLLFLEVDCYEKRYRFFKKTAVSVTQPLEGCFFGR